MSELIVVLDNIRSLHNVGSILRTCDGLGVKHVMTCGLTPYPQITDDPRLPHISKRAHNQIAKTALGAEETVKVVHFEDLQHALSKLKTEGYDLWAIEQAPNSVMLNQIKDLPAKLAVILGNEIGGVDLNQKFDQIIEIPMVGQKESFNVSVTAGIVIYQLTQK